MPHNTMITKEQRVEFWVGCLFLLIVGACVSWFLMREKSVPGYQVSALFQSVDGIGQGSDVRISGVKIGHVASIKLCPKNLSAQVVMYIHDGVKIPADSMVQVSSEGFVGPKFLAIMPGGDSKKLGKGGRFRRTRSSVSLENLLSQLVFNLGTPSKEKK